MFKKYKQKILKEVINKLDDLKDHCDIVVEAKKETDLCNDFDLGISIGVRKSINAVYEILYDNIMTKERAERTFGIQIIEDEPYSKEI